VHVETRRSNLHRSFLMPSAITALAPRLNPEMFAARANVPVLEVPKFPPPPPPDPTKQALGGLQSLRQIADEYCGTVPRHFPPPPPTGGDDGGWCGTVPHTLPFPLPQPPQPWLDLGAAAQSFR
jgi:hypothetical protein